MSSAAHSILLRQFKELTGKNGLPNFHIDLHQDNIFRWNVAVIVPASDSQSPYRGGYFKAEMAFPRDYPYSPPTFRFLNGFMHPNVFPDGRLCISILHSPGDDPTSGESAAERWSPAQSVESVLMSIVSLINEPNCSSPANVDAGVMWRENRSKYEAIVQAQVERSLKDVPAGFIMPEAFHIKPPVIDDVDENFWYDSADDDEDQSMTEDFADEESEEEDMTFDVVDQPDAEDSATEEDIN